MLVGVVVVEAAHNAAREAVHGAVYSNRPVHIGEDHNSATLLRMLAS